MSGRRGVPGTRILLTGGTGQIGSRLVPALASLGEIVAPGRGTMDLAEADSIRRTIREVRPDVIVNAAAYTDVDRAEAEPALAHRVNAAAPAIMAEEAKRGGALLVHYSSDYVFDGSKPAPYTERDAPCPINEYGRSKLAGDQAIAASGCAHLILRTSWVYDVSGRNFMLTMLRLAAERPELRVADDQIGSPTWARAIAEATADILKDPSRARAATGLYNVASRGTASRYDFAMRVLDLTAGAGLRDADPRVLRAKVADFPSPAARPRFCAMDTSKFLAAFGVPLASWEDQLAKCVAELARPNQKERNRT